MFPFLSFLPSMFRSIPRYQRRRSSLAARLLFIPTLILTPILAGSCFFPTGTEKTEATDKARVVFVVSEALPAYRDTELFADGYDSAQSLPAARAVVYDPAPSASELQVFLDGSGPGDTVLAAVPVTDSALELDLCPGDWMFQARALDAEGRSFLSGTAAARVDPAAGARVAITLSPEPGLGDLAVTYLAPTEVSASAIWACHLDDKEGLVAAAWEDPLSAAGRLVPAVPSGYYLLSTRLLDGELCLSGRVDLVRILAERSTAVSLALEIPLVGLGMDMDLDHRGPLALTASLLSRAAVRGLPLRVGAAVPENLSRDFVYRWSSLGTTLALDRVADIPTKSLPRLGTLDLIAFSVLSAGATGLPYSLNEPELKDGWCLYTGVGPEDEPASQILARPSMIAAAQAATQSGSTSAAGLVALASDETASKLELWLSDPDRNELVPGAASAIRIGGTPKRAGLLAIAGDGSYVAAAATESSWIWLVPIAPDGSPGTPAELVGGSGELSDMGYIRGLAFSPNADRLYALSNADRSIYVFQRSGVSWSLLQRFALDGQPCGVLSVLKALAISPDGSTLAVAAASSDTVVLLSVTASGLLWRSEARRTAGYAELDYPQTLAFSPAGSAIGLPDGSPSGERLAVGCKDSVALVLLDTLTVPPEKVAACAVPDGLPGPPSALSWSADGTFIGLSAPAAAALVRLGADCQPLCVSVFDVSVAASLGAPAGLAMVGPRLYLTGPEAQALVILARLPQ